MFQAKIDQIFKKTFVSIATGWHVGVIHPHEFDLLKVHFFEFFEVRPPIVFFLKGVGNRHSLYQICHRGIGGIAWVGNQNLVPRV